MAKKKVANLGGYVTVVRQEYYQSTTDQLIRCVERLSDETWQMRRQAPVYGWPDTRKVLRYEWEASFPVTQDQVSRLIELGSFKPVQYANIN